jgi:hypothetical protein
MSDIPLQMVDEKEKQKTQLSRGQEFPVVARLTCLPKRRLPLAEFGIYSPLPSKIWIADLYPVTALSF